jgi:hypothetical protein
MMEKNKLQDIKTYAILNKKYSNALMEARGKQTAEAINLAKVLFDQLKTIADSVGRSS